MDGILFNPMPYHAEAQYKTMKAHGLYLSKEEAYLYEGRTGTRTINIVCQHQLGRDVAPEGIESIYHERSIKFNKHPQAERMPDTWELLQKVRSKDIAPTVVTGLEQTSLLGGPEYNFPGISRQKPMVTAFDAKYGESSPKLYLMVLERGRLKPCETIVIEDVPLGVEAGYKAGIFTIAVNTGPLDGQILLSSGADLLFPSMQIPCESWKVLARFLYQPPLKTTIADN